MPATAFPLDAASVRACFDPAARPGDGLFAVAFEKSLSTLEPSQRCGALAGITGHIAESITEIVLDGFGWSVVWHFAGPGRHGVDLLFLGPGGERMIAVEAKGTLRPRHWPRLRRGELTQMACGWLDKSDNPAMSEWDMTSDDVHGGIVLVNFHELAYKVTLSSDFARWQPVDRLVQLKDLSWLDDQT